MRPDPRLHLPRCCSGSQCAPRRPRPPLRRPRTSRAPTASTELVGYLFAARRRRPASGDRAAARPRRAVLVQRERGLHAGRAGHELAVQRGHAVQAPRDVGRVLGRARLRGAAGRQLRPARPRARLRPLHARRSRPRRRQRAHRAPARRRGRARVAAPRAPDVPPGARDAAGLVERRQHRAQRDAAPGRPARARQAAALPRGARVLSRLRPEGAALAALAARRAAVGLPRLGRRGGVARRPAPKVLRERARRPGRRDDLSRRDARLRRPRRGAPGRRGQSRARRTTR